MNLSNVNQDSLSQKGLDRFEDMEHEIGHFTSELDSLASDLQVRNRHSVDFDPLSAAEVGILLVHLKGWRRDAAVIADLAEACERHIEENFRRQGEDASSDYYARRASFYAERADHQRELAGSDA
jgi:hypothetical protein